MIDQSLESETAYKSSMKQTTNSKLSFSQSSTVSSHYIQHHNTVSIQSIRSGASNSTVQSRRSVQKDNVTIASVENAKPTVVDTYYDLLKSLHLHISMKPIKVNLDKADTEVVITLPNIGVRSIGTKCDLEEELKSSRHVELPFTNLRHCEKTSDKLPWIFDVTGFQVSQRADET